MRTVFDQWKSFEHEVVPADAVPVQREELRRAFYAGAVSMFGLTMEAVASEDESECELNLLALDEELQAFPKDLREAQP